MKTIFQILSIVGSLWILGVLIMLRITLQPMWRLSGMSNSTDSYPLRRTLLLVESHINQILISGTLQKLIKS